MKKKLLIIIMLIFSAGIQAQSVFYIDPVNGNNSFDGTSVSTAFKTIYKARDILRTINGSMTADIYVYLRGGTYYLDSTINFYYYDSGNNGFKVIYKAYNDEKPVITGGKKISGWIIFDAGKNIYQAAVDASLDFRQLYANGRRCIRARIPNLTSPTNFAAYYTASNSNPFTVNSSHISNWANLNQVECVLVSHWKEKRARISTFNVAGSQATITFMSPEAENTLLNAWPQNPTYYYFENAYELLDQEGEWYLNKTTSTLYYKPRACEDINTIEVIAPKVENLINIFGDSLEYIHDIIFNGITFECSNWSKPNYKGYLNGQGGVKLYTDSLSIVPGMMQINYAHNIKIERNKFRHTGAHGLITINSTYGNKIIGNVFTDLSSGGIILNSDWGDAASTYDTIQNNFIEKIGQMYSDCIGILVPNIANVLITQNEIMNGPYTGISVGWSWDTTSHGCQNNDISYNKIHHVMQLHDDGGGIYTLGKMPGGIFHHNYIYNIAKSPYASTYPFGGIYLDNGSKYKEVYNNVLDSTIWEFFANNQPNQDNTFHDNYYNTTLGNVSVGNTVTSNTFFSGNNFPLGAQNIINTAGVDYAYQDILYSGVIPGKIEAENYFAMNCVQIETTTDSGSGKNVTKIDQGDWMDYNVNVIVPGIYTVNFRVACAVNGAQFEIKNGSTLLNTVSVPNTGGVQNWQVVSVNVNLSAGPQTLRIYSNQISNWNINWFKVLPLVTGMNSLEIEPSFTIYPNPSNGKIYLMINRPENNNIKRLEIYNVINECIYKQGCRSAGQQIDLSSQPEGIYFVRLTEGNSIYKSRKLIITE